MQSTSRRETQQCVLSHMNVGHPETIQSLVKKTGIPPERISRALIALADSGRISRTREFSRPVIWTRNTQQTQVSQRMEAACAAVLAAIDITGTALTSDIRKASTASETLTSGAIDLLLDRGDIIDGIGGYARPNGLNLASTYGRTVDAIRQSGSSLTRQDLRQMFPELDLSNLDAIVHRAIASGHLERTDGRVSAAVRTASRHITDDDVLAAFPEDCAISPEGLKSKLDQFDTRRLSMALKRLVAAGKIVSVSRGSYAKKGVIADALQITSRIRALLASQPTTTFTGRKVAAQLDLADVQNVRTILCRIFRDGSLLRVGKGLYRHRASQSLTLTPLEKLVLDHLSAHPNLRKVDIAGALSRGRGVINRAVSALVEKGHVSGRDQRFCIAMPDRASRPANSRFATGGEAGAL
jgi:hypothetical protein